MFSLKNLFKTQQQILKEEYLPKEREARDWQLISKSYAPPRKNLDKIEALPPEIQDRALFGATVYLWQDKLTGELRKEELLGSDEPILDELFTKVKLYGAQHVKDENGEIFVLTKYNPPVTNPLDLPLRNPGA